MNSVRLVCGGQAVDLPTDFGILINKSIADIREPENRESDWTKTFTLPGTKANNKLFTHLFNLDLSIRNTSTTQFNPDFNPNLKAGAVLYVDEVSQIEGYIRLLSINVTDHGQIEYECTMHGQLADMFATIADGRLGDLDFTEYNHDLTITNITESWDTRIQKNGSNYVNFSGGAPIGEGYVYTWIDDGTYFNYDNMFTDESTICLYAKTIVDKIFSGAGYFYSSGSFFNTAQFKRLVVPCPSRFPVLDENDILNRQFEAKRGSNTTYNDDDIVIFDTEVFDTSNQYNNATGAYTVDYSGFYDLYFQNKATVTGLASSNSYHGVYTLELNGVNVASKTTSSKSTGGGTSITFDEYLAWNQLYFVQGDVIKIKFRYIYNINGSFPGGYTYTQNTDSRFFNVPYDTGWGYGKTVQMDGFFNNEIKQRDFMKWIFTLFNLYVEPNPDNLRELVVLPRDDFYQSTVRDWTQKRDLSQPLNIIPMGELDAKRYNFTYAEGKDVGNEEYTRDYGRIYGDRRYEVVNDFLKDNKKIQTGFVPTLMNTFGDKTYPYVEASDTNTNELRLLQYKGIACTSYNVFTGGRRPSPSGATAKTVYPYAGHLDDPLNSTTDINFGMPRRVSLPGGTPYTNNSAYNLYWSKYIQEITDKDSKIVRGHFHLSPADIERLSFRDLYYFDEQYFRLNKIEDYDPVNPGINVCEFLFLKNGQTFTASTGSVGGGGEQQQEYDPRGGGTNGKVIRNKGVGVGYNSNYGDGIFAGDNISNLGRANSAFGSSGVTFLPGSERSVVIGKGVQSVGSDEVWVQGAKIVRLTSNVIVDMNSPANGDVLTYNSGTGTWEPTAPGASSFSWTLHTETASGNVTPTSGMHVYLVNATAGSVTLTLPAAATSTAHMTFKKTDSTANTVVIDGAGSETVDGALTYTIGTQYESITIISDGTNWFVI